ncbi:DUF294 nucleotidyltransferase-like domain-containing protein [Paenibacillus sp. CC-CFT747]|nr:DUF294 nucleotidyltransferase-like domain-containing protein [Paenibacillus sp. CC-CFT747]
MIRRTVQLAEQLVKEEGMGAAPVPYAFVLYGSGARREQTLWSDQDNGLLYQNPSQGEEEAVEAYFERLAAAISEGLQEAGYPPCEGGVVCTNPQWRKPLKAYLEMLAGWEQELTWESVRYLLISSDLRCVYGDERLCRVIVEKLFGEARRDSVLLERMLHNTLHRKTASGFFGRIITERYGEDAGGFDVKYGAYIPLVNGIRMLAVCCGLTEASTLDRVKALHRIQVIGSGTAGYWRQAFLEVLHVRALVPRREENGLYHNHPYLNRTLLTAEVQKELKHALAAGRKLRSEVKKQVKRQTKSLLKEEGAGYEAD